MLKPRYIMVGGFLGAGKTTAILQLARRMRDQKIRVGLITNDQSSGLVDTTMLQSHGFATEEITGGCFCCMFNSLVDAANKLAANTHPDVFVAEPVGSCTDLQATVTFPLRRMYGDNYSISPLSVVLDPVRTARILGLEPGPTFSRKVRYIFEKQLEEADVLVINKCDRIDELQQSRLQQELERRFPRAKVLRVSARTGSGIDQWLALLQQEENQGTALIDVDYDVYAEGEALLGWLNLSATVCGSEFDGNEFLRRLGSSIRQRLDENDIPMAHLKMTLTPQTGNDLAVGNIVRNQAALELSHELDEPLEEGALLVNLRAEAAPEILQPIVDEELQRLASSSGVTATIDHLDAFRPGRPQPTHRLVQLTLTAPG
jgi:Ni2+-binding GTPase involved in maturation of urease and hydrogenase